MREADARYLPLIQKAKEEARKTKDTTKLDVIQEEYQVEHREWSDPLWGMRSRHLVARASKYHIYLDDIQLGEDESHWTHGYFDEYLEDDTKRELKRRVWKAEREHRKERREEWAFWLAMVLGLIGALTGLVSVLKSQ